MEKISISEVNTPEKIKNKANELKEKYKRFPDLFCEDCLKDNEIICKRDKDVKCLKCGTELCGYHIVKHLKEKHLISLTWKGFE